MPIQVNRRLPELGRIRIGSKNERGHPQKLTKFRLTSKDRNTIEEAASVYGGTPRPWAGHEGEFEVFTNVNEIAILVAPEPISQDYELWSGGGCKRRCDGETCNVPGEKGMEQVPCMCDPENRECGIKTRASFILPDLPGLGRWRLDTGSYYAATELPGQVELLQMFKAQGQRPPEAVLAIEVRKYQRQVNGLAKTFTPSVVTIRFRDTIRQLLSAGEGASVQQITAASGPKSIQAASAPAVPLTESENSGTNADANETKTITEESPIIRFGKVAKKYGYKMKSITEAEQCCKGLLEIIRDGGPTDEEYERAIILLNERGEAQ